MPNNESHRGHDSQESHSGAVKPAVPLEKMIQRNAATDDQAAADRLASEAAKSPGPSDEGPFEVDPPSQGSVADIIDARHEQARREEGR